MPRDFPHLAARLFGTPLLIDERKLDAIVPAFMRRLNGEDDAPGDGGGDYREPGEPRYANGVAVIPVIGSLVRRKSMMDAWSGLTSYSDIATCLRCALDDPRVRAILLQVDSFGGEASGCFELCDELYAARGRKPIWAVGDVDALSAGYAILAQADRVLVAPSGSAGSIGAVAVHCERSQFNEAMGYTYTVFRAGTRKAELNSLEPITKAAAEKVAASLAKVRPQGPHRQGGARYRGPVLRRGRRAAPEAGRRTANLRSDIRRAHRQRRGGRARARAGATARTGGGRRGRRGSRPGRRDGQIGGDYDD
jgi:hypothetical protein